MRSNTTAKNTKNLQLTIDEKLATIDEKIDKLQLTIDEKIDKMRAELAEAERGHREALKSLQRLEVGSSESAAQGGAR